MSIEIIKSFKEKVQILKRHNNLYFNQNKPKISDSEYDNLKRELLELEKKHDYLKKLKLLKNIVGAPLTNQFKKIEHLSPMLSLANAFDKKDMLDFIKKIQNFLNIKQNNIQLFSEPKIDGISATLILRKRYFNQRFV